MISVSTTIDICKDNYPQTISIFISKDSINVHLGPQVIIRFPPNIPLEELQYVFSHNPATISIYRYDQNDRPKLEYSCKVLSQEKEEEEEEEEEEDATE